MDIYRVTGGKISEERAAVDVAAIMAQIGAFNPPWAAWHPGPAACGIPEPGQPVLPGLCGGLPVFA